MARKHASKIKFGRRAIRRVDGYVWCDRHGEIHEDSLDPYQYGEPTGDEEDERCWPFEHFNVYARTDLMEDRE